MIITNKSNCCGCTACASICTRNAITMHPDSLGFLYPKINQSACIDCGLCSKVCQFKKDYNTYNNFHTPKILALRLKDEEQLSRSQSGGVFFAIANFIIKANGVVYGAAFTDTWRVTHQKATKEADLEKLRMSKYIQSDLRSIFPSIKEDLKKGLHVLFSGTGCQVSGLKSYIPNNLHCNLTCIDIICHGVPSPRIWEEYIAYLERTRKSKILKACFRDKRFGWHGATESFLYENGKEEFRKTSNHLYFSGLSTRESCAQCYFTNLKRVGDITIGDFWGIPKDSPYEDGKGLSLAIINSPKGDFLINKILTQFCVEESTLENCLQPQLERPAKMNPRHKKFRKDYTQKGFLYIAKHYSDIGWRYKKETIISTLKNRIKLIIKQ